MKTIYWNYFGKEIFFSLNWFEYLILKRIFKKRKYKSLKPKELRGHKANIVMVDEISNEAKEAINIFSTPKGKNFFYENKFHFGSVQ